MAVQRKHVYRAEAFALAGQLRLPLSEDIKPVAFASLAAEGGYLSRRAENFRLEAVVSFRSAYTQVAGNLDDKKDHGWNTLTTAVIEGLNVLDVVTADRIVMQIGTDYPLKGYVPTVTFLGTRFERLRIAGHEVKVDLDLDMLGFKPAKDAFYSTDRDFLKRVKAQYDRIRGQRNVPAEVATRYNRLPSGKKDPRVIECSLVNKVEGGYPGRNFGHVIDVPNFGKIYLATLRLDETEIDPDTKVPKTLISLNMIEMQMGCLGGGTLLGGGGKTNGQTAP